jgi:hypothetical protein
MVNGARLTLVTGMAALLVLAPWIAAAEPSSPSPPSAPQPAICLQLSISVQQFDPAKPTGAIRCVVTNRTDRAIEIAERYDGKQIALIGHSHRWPLRLWDRTRDRPESKTVVVEPGQQRVLFEFPLAEILRRQDPNTVRQDFQAGRRLLVWDWPAMPAPPPSPIYVGRDGEPVDKAVFRAELTVEDAVIASNEVVLKVGRERASRAAA